MKYKKSIEEYYDIDDFGIILILYGSKGFDEIHPRETATAAVLRRIDSDRIFFTSIGSSLFSMN